jgi:outer membrane assembly lipoprotein YfgL
VNAFSWRWFCAVLVLLSLLSCSSTPVRPKPVDLPTDPKLLGVRLAWSSTLTESTGLFWSTPEADTNFSLDVKVTDKSVALASTEGTVSVLDSRTGDKLWRIALAEPLAAGVGFDGQQVAVMTRNNELVMLDAGRELWRQRMTAPSFTAPFIAGARVFVLSADRSVTAFDGLSGRRIWTQQRPGEPLVLRQSGVLLAVGDVLVVGLSGKLVGLNPLNGGVRWEVPIASPRGTNDVERLVDLVSPVARNRGVVCARAFQAAVGCVDAVRGVQIWSKPAAGALGVQGDEGLVYGVESDSTLVAWKRPDGERAWSLEKFRFRSLTAPLVMGRLLVLGDDSGNLHFLASADGALQTRVNPDGSAIAATPVMSGNTLIAVTRNGGVFGYRPE